MDLSGIAIVACWRWLFHVWKF